MIFAYASPSEWTQRGAEATAATTKDLTDSQCGWPGKGAPSQCLFICMLSQQLWRDQNRCMCTAERSSQEAPVKQMGECYTISCQGAGRCCRGQPGTCRHCTVFELHRVLYSLYLYLVILFILLRTCLLNPRLASNMLYS